MNVRFLGSASSVPNVGNDCPCFLVNNKYLVDCGYSVLTALSLLEKAKFKKLIFIHISDKWHVRIYPVWEVDNGEKRLLDICKTVPYPIAIAHDGDEFLL